MPQCQNPLQEGVRKKYIHFQVRTARTNTSTSYKNEYLLREFLANSSFLQLILVDLLSKHTHTHTVTYYIKCVCKFLQHETQVSCITLGAALFIPGMCS